MKRNLHDAKNDTLQALMASIIWASPPAPGIVVAALTDDSLWTEDDLATCLAETERNRAGQMADPVERRHYILRRCFQRVFLKILLDWQGALPDLRIVHRVDTQPHCPDAPLYRLSFSSSGSTALACASLNHQVGIDVEKIRTIESVAQLAQRFFTAEESASTMKCARNEQGIHFLHLWTAKEAGLKAIGKGIVSGLNSFVVTHIKNNYTIEKADKLTGIGPWSLRYLELLPQHIVAVVHRPDNSETAFL